MQAAARVAEAAQIAEAAKVEAAAKLEAVAEAEKAAKFAATAEMQRRDQQVLQEEKVEQARLLAVQAAKNAPMDRLKRAITGQFATNFETLFHQAKSFLSSLGKAQPRLNKLKTLTSLSTVFSF